MAMFLRMAWCTKRVKGRADDGVLMNIDDLLKRYEFMAKIGSKLKRR